MWKSKKQALREAGFSKYHWKLGRVKTFLGRTLTIQCFCYAKENYCKHRLIKISAACVYIKPEVKKNDTKAMTAAINEACIGWLDENCCLLGKEWHFW